MHPYVHSSTIHNGQETEITKVFINRWMDKEVVHIYSGILLGHKKEWNNAICSNMDATRDYHTKWSKPERERQIPYDITYMWNLKYDTNEPICETETESWTQRTHWGLPKGRGLEEVCSGRLGLADESFHIENGWMTRSYCIAQRTMFALLWWTIVDML